MPLLPVPTPRTWAPNDVVTGTMANTNIRDAFNFLLNPPKFKGTLQTATAITTGPNIDFGTPQLDTYSGWDATNKRYVCQVAGRYFAKAQLKCDSTNTGPMAVRILVSSTFGGLPQNITSPNFAYTAYHGASADGYLQLAVGDQVSIQSFYNFTSQPDPGDNNFFELQWVSL